MKTTKITLSLAILMVAGALTFTSCKKKDKTVAQEPDNEQTSATDNNLAESAASDIESIGSQASENGSILFKSADATNSELMLLSNCATVTSNAAGTVVATSYTIDFGTTGCVGNDGRTRVGKLFYDFSQSAVGAKRYRNPGFKMIVTSANYAVDANTITINNKTVTNTTPIGIGTGTNPGTNLTWSIVSSITVAKSGGGTVTWSCNRTKELTNTSDPNCYKGQLQAIDWTKAIVKLNGSASGVNGKGENYTAVATDLVRDFTCTPDPLKVHRHPFISGKIAYTPGSRATRTINYGTGTCDFNATVEINGQTWAITLN
jgi:hypothetical protein